MNLHCSVKVIYRLATHSMNSSTNYKNAVISVVKPSKESEIYLILVTQNNKAGYRYKIRNNIEKTFGQFLRQGKCTIRFKEPCHDLYINAEIIPLKNFMLFIKKVWEGDKSLNHNINSEVNVVPKSKTKLYKLEIKKKENYPVLQGFKSTLQTVLINGCNLSKFDSRILKLKHLTTLSLSRNKIKLIPSDLGSLSLTHLFLDNNNLHDEKWTFLSGTISKTLKCLDLSCNNIKFLPPSLTRFHSLRILKVSKNLISSVPSGICTLPKLRELDLSCNQFSALPCTILRRSLKKLDILDVSHNKNLLRADETDFKYAVNIALEQHCRSSVFSLLELSAQRVIESRLEYNEEILPNNLVRLLDNAGECVCGKITLKTYRLISFTLEALLIANTFISTESEFIVPVCYTSCSP